MHGFRPVIDLFQWLVAAPHTAPGAQVGTWLLALVFAWSGTVKLHRPRRAAVAIASFRVLRKPKAWQGAALGAFELSLGLGLASGRLPTPTLVATSVLLTVFSALILRSLVAGEHFPCFCFGADDDRLSWASFGRTGFLALLSYDLWLTPSTTTGAGLLGEETYLALLTATGLLLLTVSLGRVPRLVAWNREVVDHFRERTQECRQCGEWES
jgi:hypothetical protein